MVRHIDDYGVLLLIAVNNLVNHRVVVGCGVVVVSQHILPLLAEVMPIVIGSGKVSAVFGEARLIVDVLAHEVVDDEG